MTTGTLTNPVAAYALRHGDDSLVLAQRLAEWIANAPDLEEDIALANFALDHLGVATHLLGYAASVEGDGRSDDDLAFLRTEREYGNLLLVEQPNGDFGQTMARLLFFDAYQLVFWEALSGSGDETLAGIAAKALKEASYHFRHSSAWVVRLGDGTAESHLRMQAGLDWMARFTAELFETDELDRDLIAEGIAVDVAALGSRWRSTVEAVLDEATLSLPDVPQRSGGRSGYHTEYLGHLLTEMQWMQRTYPGLQW